MLVTIGIMACLRLLQKQFLARHFSSRNAIQHLQSQEIFW